MALQPCRQGSSEDTKSAALTGSSRQIPTSCALTAAAPHLQMPRPKGPAVSPRETAHSGAPCPPIQPTFPTEATQYSPGQTCAAHQIPRQASAHTLDVSPHLAVPVRRCRSVGLEQPGLPNIATQGPVSGQEPSQTSVTGVSGSSGHASALTLLLSEAQEAPTGTDGRSVNQAAAGFARPAKVAYSKGQARLAQQQRVAPPGIIAGFDNDSDHHPDLASPNEPDLPPPDDCLALLLSFFSKEEIDDEDSGLCGAHTGSGPGDSDITWQGSQDTGLDNHKGSAQAGDSAGRLAPPSVPVSVISATVECLGCDARRLSGSGTPPIAGACPAALAVAAAAAAAAVTAVGGPPGAATVTVTNDCEGLPQWLPASPFLPPLSPFLASLDHDEVEALDLSAEGMELLLPDDADALEHDPVIQGQDLGASGSLQEASLYESSTPSAPCNSRTIGTSVGIRKCSTSSSSMDDTWACPPDVPRQPFALGEEPGTAVVRLSSVASSSAVAAWCATQPGAHAKLEPDDGLSPAHYVSGELRKDNNPTQGGGRASYVTQTEALYLVNPLKASSHDHSASCGPSPDAWVAVMGCYELPLDKHKSGDPGWASPSAGLASAQSLLCPASNSGKQQKRRRESSVQAEEGEGQEEGGGGGGEGRESEGASESGDSDEDKEQEEQEEQDSQEEDEGAQSSFDLNVLFKSVEHKQWEHRGPNGGKLEPTSPSHGTAHQPSMACPTVCAVTDRLLHTNGERAVLNE